MTKVQRNSPCSCGSGKKFKQCCFKKSLRPLKERISLGSPSQGLKKSGQPVAQLGNRLAGRVSNLKVNPEYFEKLKIQAQQNKNSSHQVFTPTDADYRIETAKEGKTS